MAQEDDNASLDTLETPGSLVVESEPGKDPVANPQTPKSPDTPLPKQRRFRMRLPRGPHFNLYLLGLVVAIVVIIAAIIIGLRVDKSGQQASLPPSTTLTQEELSRLKNTDAQVGDPQQTLTIESNTVINGRVLLRDDLDVAGTIKVGGSLNLPGITVSGTSNFDQIQASKLSITGDTTIQGQLNVQRNLTVSGSLSVGGTLSAAQLAVQNLSLSGDLQLNRHLDAGGSTPSRSNGSSIGSGGTTSVSGTDTAGTATINTGSGPSAGCFITITFATKFNATPHVVVTPVGSAGAGLSYYINRSNTNFSICSTSAPSASSSFSFDYVVID